MLTEKNMRVVVRGGGDLASGVIAKLYHSGFQVVVLECRMPAAIRRTVSFSEAVYQKEVTVEGITAKLADEEIVERILAEEKIPVLVDPEGDWIHRWNPDIVVDAILAKRNLGTRIEMAPVTIGLGPGFVARLCGGKGRACGGGDQKRPRSGTDLLPGKCHSQYRSSRCDRRRCRGAGYLRAGRRDPYRLPDDRRPGTQRRGHSPDQRLPGTGFHRRDLKRNTAGRLSGKTGV